MLIIPFNPFFLIGTVKSEITDTQSKNFDFHSDFYLSNETLVIDSLTIYDASFDYTAMVYSNQTDSGLIVTFNYQNLTLQSNKTFTTSGISTQINFKLTSPGNSTDYYPSLKKIMFEFSFFFSILDISKT
jgi:hypothetical protein